MDLIGVKVTVIVLSLLLLILCVLVLCKFVKKTYFRLIIFSIISFVFSMLYLAYVFAFSREKDIEYSLYLLGIIAGFVFFIILDKFKDDVHFEITSKNKLIAFIITSITGIGLVSALIVIYYNFRNSINVSKFIFLVLALTFGVVTLYFLLKNILTPSKGNKMLQIIKIIDVLMICELIIGFCFSFCGIFNNMLAFGILIIVFLLVQYFILFLVYRGYKYE